ncbi:MAG: hypothetical protein PHC34_02485 [Candidatus Gastranaerophilales bacterium]|nr:hypothetical protein [Candidatus Gastranaerophilales bacterium]
MSQKYLKNVLGNAFDFLENAIGQIYEQPKYSVINYCSAIELILKAKLLNEHWSLLIDGKPNLCKFEQGNFKSIDFKSIIQRIVDVTNEKLPIGISESFHALADHRNKMIHFFHEAHTEDAGDEIKADIIAEQDKAWIILQELFEKWSDIFAPDEYRIEKLNDLMQDIKRKDYYKKRFEKVKSKIDEEKQKGIVFKTCRRCTYPASREQKLTDYLFQYRCKVCKAEEEAIKVYCLNCDYLTEIDFNNIDIECEQCNIKIDRKRIIDLLDTEIVTGNNYNDYTVKNCSNCSSLESVIQHDNYYICTECSYITEYIEYCEYCGEGQIGGDLEDSYLTGCEACDGCGIPDD